MSNAHGFLFLFTSLLVCRLPFFFFFVPFFFFAVVPVSLTLDPLRIPTREVLLRSLGQIVVAILLVLEPFAFVRLLVALLPVLGPFELDRFFASILRILRVRVQPVASVLRLLRVFVRVFDQPVAS